MGVDILPALQTQLTLVRSQIVETIGEDIGVYTFPDDSTDPAIAILGLGSSTEVYPPKDTSVSGLEVVLVTLNNIRIEKRLDGIIQYIPTKIVLKQFDPSKNTVTPLLKLLGVLDCEQDPIRVIPDPLMGNIEVCEFQILHSFYSNDTDY